MCARKAEKADHSALAGIDPHGWSNRLGESSCLNLLRTRTVDTNCHSWLKISVSSSKCPLHRRRQRRDRHSRVPSGKLGENPPDKQAFLIHLPSPTEHHIHKAAVCRSVA